MPHLSRGHMAPKPSHPEHSYSPAQTATVKDTWLRGKARSSQVGLALLPLTSLPIFPSLLEPRHISCVLSLNTPGTCAPWWASVRERGQGLNPRNAWTKRGAEQGTQMSHKKRCRAWCRGREARDSKGSQQSWTWKLREVKANRIKVLLKKERERGRDGGREGGRELFTANSRGN